MQKTPGMSSTIKMCLFFAIGIISAFAFRFLIIFHHISPNLVRPVWYIGIIGYTLFFFYRYEISRKRKRAVNDFRLLDKLSGDECLKGEAREAAKYLCNSVTKSKEDINYLVIFVLSIATVIIDLVLTYSRR